MSFLGRLLPRVAVPGTFFGMADILNTPVFNCFKVTTRPVVGEGLELWGLGAGVWLHSCASFKKMEREGALKRLVASFSGLEAHLLADMPLRIGQT